MVFKNITIALLSVGLITTHIPSEAGILPKFSNTEKIIIIGVGSAAAHLASQNNRETLENLRSYPNLAQEYFTKFPGQFNVIKNLLLQKLKNFTSIQDYEEYKTLAIEMGLKESEIPRPKTKYDWFTANDKLKHLLANPHEAKFFAQKNKNKQILKNIQTLLVDTLVRTSDITVYEKNRKLADILGTPLPDFAIEKGKILNKMVNVQQPQDPKDYITSTPIQPQNLEHYITSTPIQSQDPKDYITSTPIEDKPATNIIFTPQGEPIDTKEEFPLEEPKTWKDYVLLKQDSTELGENIDNAEKLKDPNYVKPNNVASHHIVPAKHKDAQEARDILDKYLAQVTPSGQKTYNNEINGVNLPNANNQDSNVPGILHNGNHPKDYVQKVNARIRDADKIGGWSEVQKELEKIKQELLKASRNDKWKDIL